MEARSGRRELALEQIRLAGEARDAGGRWSATLATDYATLEREMEEALGAER